MGGGGGGGGTFKALKINSGVIVFFPSYRQILFASDEMCLIYTKRSNKKKIKFLN